MEGEDFGELLEGYLTPPGDPNPEMEGVEIVWVRDNANLGSLHIQEHGITEQQVEEVLFEVPPYVEARRHGELSDRTIFWGATRDDVWLFVVCADWTEDGIRYLKPLTAYSPDKGEEYWKRQ